MNYLFTKSEKMNYERYIKNIGRTPVWNKKTLSAFSELNAKILEMQNFVYRKMLSVNQEFLKLQTEFSFLKGFQVIGQIGFEKTILNNDSDEEDREIWPEEQKKEYALWVMLNDYTDSKVWQLTYDSLLQDFTPYSKDLLKETVNSRRTGLPEDCGFNIASYLNSIVSINQSITFKDLQKCTIGDFYPFVFVTVNFDEPEIVGFRNYRCNLPEDIEAMLSDRKRLHNHNFQWTEENIKKILEVNDAVNKKSAFIKDSMIRLQTKFMELGKTERLFEHFDIEAEIQYQNREHPTEVADKKLLKMLEDNTNFSIYNIHCDDETEKVIDHWHEYNTEDRINWNFELFKNQLSEEQQKIPFNYFMHGIFVDGNTYSLEDLVNMKDEDFKICWDINVNNFEGVNSFKNE